MVFLTSGDSGSQQSTHVWKHPPTGQHWYLWGMWLLRLLRGFYRQPLKEPIFKKPVVTCWRVLVYLLVGFKHVYLQYF